MRVIYVAGKYSGEDYEEIDTNIYCAEMVSVELLKKGWSVITPHKNTSHYEEYEDYLNFNHAKWLEVDFALLRLCDAICMLIDWKDSKGAVQEHKLAQDLKIPIILQSDYINILDLPTPEEVFTDAEQKETK